MIMVVKRETFDQLGDFQGFHFDVEHYMPTLLQPGNNYFIPRTPAENDPSHKQIIPYLILSQNNRFLHYTRGKKGGEKRLASKGSIGIGGHVNDIDHAAAGLDSHAYHQAIIRELEEEISHPPILSQQIIGLLNDDSNEVGQVHLGIVHLITLSPEGVVESREDSIQDPTFLSLEELLARREQLETWSQICVDALPAVGKR